MSSHPAPDIGHLSHPGRVRRRNEDSYGLPPPNLSPEVLAARGRLYLVADGMGGHQGGERASQIAAQRIVQEYYAGPVADPQQSLARAIHLVNAEIYQEASRSPELRSMGTTLTAAVIRGHDLVVAHIGDSRAYLVRNGVAQQLTQDHSYVAENLRLGTLTPEQASTHPYRGVITRALGKPDAQPDFGHERLLPGDTVLLCSDGLSNEVDQRQIESIVSRSRSRQDAVNRLVEEANRRGGRDNITALAVGADGHRGRGGATLPAWAWPLIGGVVALIVVFGIVVPLIGPGPTPTPTPGALAEVTLPPTGTLGLEEDIVGPTATEGPPATATTPTPPNFQVTPTFTPTHTPAPGPTRRTPTRTPSPVPPGQYPAPALKSPETGSTINVPYVKLEWQWEGELKAGEKFDVRVWRLGTPDHSGIARTVDRFHEIRDLGSWQVGTYQWSIAVNRDGDHKQLSPESEVWDFVWQGPQTPTFTPSVTPTPSSTPSPTPSHTPTPTPTSPS